MRLLPRASGRARASGRSRRFWAWLATWLADRRRERQSQGVPVPNAPSDLMVSVEEGFFIVNWVDHASDEAGFRVYRKEFGGDYYIVGEFPEGTTVFGDYYVEPGVYYTYYVVAFNAGGESARSNEAGGQLPSV